MAAPKGNPVPLVAGRAPDSFCLGAERPEDSRTAVRLQENVLETRTTLLRDFVFGALAPVESDAAAARLCLTNDDDAGTRYHLKRIVECVNAAASTFHELEALTGRAR